MIESPESKPKQSSHHREDINNDETISLIDIYLLIRKRWKLVVILSVAFGFLGLAYAYLPVLLGLPAGKSWLPDTYQSTSIALLNDGSSGSGLSAALGSSDLGGLASLAGVKMPSGGTKGALAALLCKTSAFADELDTELGLVQRWGLASAKRDQLSKILQNQLKVTNDSTTSTLSISCIDTDPRFAADLVNSAMKVLEKRFQAIGGDKTLTEKNLLEAKLADVKVQMASLESQMQKLQQKYGIIDVGSATKAQIESTASLRSNLIMKEMEIKTYSQLSPVDDPTLIRLKTERDNMTKLIQEMETGYSDYQSFGPSQNELPKLALQYAHLQREIMVQTEIYKSLTQQYEMIKLSAAGTTPSFQVLERAQVSSEKTGPQRSIFPLAGLAGGLFIGCFLCFFLEYLAKLRRDPKILAKLKGAPHQ